MGETRDGNRFLILGVWWNDDYAVVKAVNAFKDLGLVLYLTIHFLSCVRY